MTAELAITLHRVRYAIARAMRKAASLGWSVVQSAQVLLVASWGERQLVAAGCPEDEAGWRVQSIYSHRRFA